MSSDEVHGKADAIQPPASHPFFPPKVGEEQIKEAEKNQREPKIETDKAKKARNYIKDGNIDLAKLCSETKIQTPTGELRALRAQPKPDGTIEIRYEAQASRPITIPQLIPLNRETLRFFGMIEDETTKTGELRRLEFQDTTLGNVQFFAKVLREAWRIDDSQIDFDIRYSRPDAQQAKARVIETVSSALDIPRENVRFYETADRSQVASELGVVRASVGSVAFREVITQTLEKVVKPLAEADHEHARWYLTGIFARHGAPITREGTTRRGIQLSISYRRGTDEPEHYCRVLKTLGVALTAHAVQKNDILVQGWQNLLTLAKATEGELAMPDKAKTARFLRALLSHRFIVDLDRELQAIGDDQPTTKQIGEALKIERPTTVRMLGRLRDLQLVTRTESGHGRDLEHQYRYTLTQKGKDLLQTVNQVRKRLQELEPEHPTPTPPIPKPPEESPKETSPQLDVPASPIELTHIEHNGTSEEDVNEFLRSAPEKIREHEYLATLVLTYDRRRHLHPYYLENSPWFIPKEKALPTITRATAIATHEEQEQVKRILDENSEWIPLSAFQWACEILNEFPWTKLNEVNALSRRGRTPHRIHFPDAHIDATPQIIELITRAIDKVGIDRQLAEKLGVSRSLITLYRLGSRRPSLDALQETLKILELKTSLIDLIDGLKLYGSHGTKATMRVRSRLDPVEAYLIAYVAGDGSNLATAPRLTVNCQDRSTLEDQWNLWQTTYQLQPTTDAQILADRSNWRLDIRNASLRHYLTRFYESTLGPAAKVREIPVQVATSDAEIAKAYLAGTIDSEGNIKRYPSGVAAFQISTVSLPFALQTLYLLWRLGYRSVKLYNPAGEFQAQITRSEEVAWILYDTLPYLRNRPKIEAIVEVLGAKEYLDTVRLRRTRPLLELLTKTVTKCKGLGELQRQYGIPKSSIWKWLHEKYETVPLTAIVKCCEIFKEEPLKYVDPRLSALLWVQRLIPAAHVVELRGHVSPQLLCLLTNLPSPSFSKLPLNIQIQLENNDPLLLDESLTPIVDVENEFSFHN